MTANTRTVALVGALLLAACGRKGPPVAPELVRPEPAEDLTAAIVADGVRLTWQRPLRYSGGQRMNDLDHFVIDRAPAEAARPIFGHVGRLDLDDQTRFRKERHLEWIDHDAVRGASYLYRVVAVTRDGSQSAPAGPVEVEYAGDAP
ncbi:MAG TPA: lipoprotein [Candidatus Binatus sp.]|nr:lipoprotein [Candidatus Binatus sp.]